MELSACGEKMARMSDLRKIMDDISVHIKDKDENEYCNLSIGNPAAIPLVVDMWHRVMGEVLSSDFKTASCQYGLSRGHSLLLDSIKNYFNMKFNWSIDVNNIVVGPGCQMLAFAAVSLFSGPSKNGLKKIVLPLVPEYTGYQSLPTQENCIIGIEPKIVLLGDRSFTYEIDIPALRAEKNIGLIMISNPMNPSGRYATSQELSEIITFAEERDIPIFIDNAYGSPFPKVVSGKSELIWHSNVINSFSASKAGMPGERIGFLIGNSKYINIITSFMANTVLHAPQLLQVALSRVIDSGELDCMSGTVINPYYKEKYNFTHELLHTLLPVEVPWRIFDSDGGMFCWIWINDKNFDGLYFYQKLKEKNIFIMPGQFFFINEPEVSEHGRQCFRISLSAHHGVIAKGIETIALTLTEMYQKE